MYCYPVIYYLFTMEVDALVLDCTRKGKNMRSDELDLTVYDSDKIESDYLRRYDPVFESFLNRPIKLLEIGIYKGGSLLLWKDYFPLGSIVGIDINIPEVNKELLHPRISMFMGSQTDTTFLSTVAEESAPDGFDIIIDDASHFGEFTKTSFWYLFNNYLKSGGIYVIEDWGTGYWSNWRDGKKLNLKKYEKEKYLITKFKNNSLFLKITGKLNLKF